MVTMPTAITLDFCEWLYQDVTHREHGDDFFQIVLNERFQYALKEQAQEYLERHSVIRGNQYLLHQFLDECFDSPDFEQFSDRYMRHPDDFDRFLHHFFHHIGYYHYYHSKWYKEWQSWGENVRLDDKNSPEKLANSARALFRYPSSVRVSKELRKPMLHFMCNLGSAYSLEIEFLNWLDNLESVPNLSVIPEREFQALYAIPFQEKYHKSDKDRQRLTNAYKNAAILQGAAQTRKHLGELGLSCLCGVNGHDMNAYFQDNHWNRYKCVIIPLSTGSPIYGRMTSEQWSLFNSLSGEYLDIFYWEANYSSADCGYDIASNLKGIPDSVKQRLPVLALWKSSPEQAKAIDISGSRYEDMLDVGYLRRLLEKIVGDIRQGETLEEIAKEANEMSEQLQKENQAADIRPTVHNTGIIGTYVGGNNSAPIAISNLVGGNNSSSMSVTNAIASSSEMENLLREITEAKSRIAQMPDLDAKTREYLEKDLKDAETAVKENDERKKDAVKWSFDKTLATMADKGAKLISVLAGLATLAKFFGFGV